MEVNLSGNELGIYFNSTLCVDLTEFFISLHSINFTLEHETGH